MEPTTAMTLAMKVLRAVPEPSITNWFATAIQHMLRRHGKQLDEFGPLTMASAAVLGKWLSDGLQCAAKHGGGLCDDKVIETGIDV